MKKIFATLLFAVLLVNAAPCFAATHGHNRGVTPKSIGAGVCSLLIWPGIGQIINDQSKEKDLTHAVLGLTGIFRFWSAYDAFVDRNGGVWGNRI